LKHQEKEQKKMNKIIVQILIVAGLIGFLTTVNATAQDATEIMKKSHLAYYYAADDGITEVEMSIVDKRGRERIRKFTMFRLDQQDGGDQKYYTYFHEPSDVRRMTFMVHVSGRLWTKDAHTLLREDKLNEAPVWVIESVPQDEDYGGYSRRVSFIAQDSYLPLREEYYDDKDELERVFTAEKVETSDGIETITTRKMENVQENRHTTVTFNSIDYNVGIEEEVFTQRYLKNPPREYIK
jgi:hypothetical protein